MIGPPISMAETSSGKIWMGTLESGFFLMTQGRITNHIEGIPGRKTNCLLPVGENQLWIGTDKGLFRWNGATLIPAELPPALDHLQILTMLQDRDSNIWVGTAQGLLRINAKGISFTDENGLGGGGAVYALFEDREGNLWAGGTHGLERIRDSAFVTYSLVPDGAPQKHNGPVYVDSANRSWFAPQEGGIYLLRNGRA
jgi:ligand-binding sensor domain-containing protein